MQSIPITEEERLSRINQYLGRAAVALDDAAMNMNYLPPDYRNAKFKDLRTRIRALKNKIINIGVSFENNFIIKDVRANSRNSRKKP